MKRYTHDELQGVLAEHKKWLLSDGRKRADLRDADLRGAYLQRADLRDADLRGADLRDADLRGADLQGAYLQGTDLQRAGLRDLKIKKAAVFTGLYTYLAMPIIADDGTGWVRLGCHTRKVADWEAEFWNNPREFPNDGSVKSQERVMAYKTCLEWLRIHGETK